MYRCTIEQRRAGPRLLKRIGEDNLGRQDCMPRIPDEHDARDENTANERVEEVKKLGVYV